MNRQTIVLIAVAVVAAIAAILVLLPSDGPVTVPKSTAQGTATVSPSGDEFAVGAAPTSAPIQRRMTSSLDYVPTPKANPRRVTEGLVPLPGLPLDRHGQKDSHLWIGMYRMLLQDNGGPTDLGDRVHDMGTKVAGVTAAGDLASYAPLFADERKLIAEVRESTTNAQILENCDSLEAAIAAIESGHLHPVDKEFETAEATAPDAAP